MLLFAQMGNVRKEIFLKGEKRTDDIISCVRSGRFYKITFKSHKTYTYSYYDVFLSTFDKIIYNTICFLQYLK